MDTSALYPTQRGYATSTFDREIFVRAAQHIAQRVEVVVNNAPPHLQRSTGVVQPVTIEAEAAVNSPSADSAFSHE
jgi:hypothetical protein